jgi:hypothetical protein
MLLSLCSYTCSLCSDHTVHLVAWLRHDERRAGLSSNIRRRAPGRRQRTALRARASIIVSMTTTMTVCANLAPIIKGRATRYPNLNGAQGARQHHGQHHYRHDRLRHLGVHHCRADQQPQALRDLRGRAPGLGRCALPCARAMRGIPSTWRTMLRHTL